MVVDTYNYITTKSEARGSPRFEAVWGDYLKQTNRIRRKMIDYTKKKHYTIRKTEKHSFQE